MRKHYQTYIEIPPLISEYIVSVAHVREIEEIPLPVINEFLEGLHEFYENKSEEVLAS